MTRPFKNSLALTPLLFSLATASVFASKPEWDEPVKRSSDSHTANSAKRQRTADLQINHFEQLNPYIIEKILRSFDCERDLNLLINVSRTNKMFYGIIDTKYEKYLRQNHSKPWMDRPLKNQVLFIANKRLIKMMGLFDNWNILEPEEKKYFTHLSNRFATTVCLPTNHPVKMYVSLLSNHPRIEPNPLSHNSPNQMHFNQMHFNQMHFNQMLQNMLNSNIANQENEMALYFHYVQNIISINPAHIRLIKNSEPWINSKNPLLSVTRDNLLELRTRMSGVDPQLENPLTLEEWSNLLEMETFPTLKQVEWTVNQAIIEFLFGNLLPHIDVLNLQTQFIENKKFYGIQIASQDYKNLAMTYAFKDEFNKAADYYEIALEEQRKIGENPKVEDYGMIGDLYYKCKNFEKAAENFEIYINGLKTNREFPEAHHYDQLAFSYFQIGNLIKAAEYKGLYIDAILSSGNQPDPLDYENIMHIYYTTMNFYKLIEVYQNILSNPQIITVKTFYIDYMAANAYYALREYQSALWVTQRYLVPFLEETEYKNDVLKLLDATTQKLGMQINAYR